MIETIVAFCGVLALICGLIWALIRSERAEFEQALKAAQKSAEVERGKIAKDVRAKSDTSDDGIMYRD